MSDITKTNLTVKISIKDESVNGDPGYNVLVSIGDTKMADYYHPDQDIYTEIGKLVSRCLMNTSLRGLMRLNNIKAFE